jgi:hypothetical protein
LLSICRRHELDRLSDVTGPGEALLLAFTSRSVALNDLDGDGLPTLRQRVADA